MVENRPFIVDVSIKDGNFPVRKLLVHRRIEAKTKDERLEGAMFGPIFLAACEADQIPKLFRGAKMKRTREITPFI